jgi:hypothetical protein
MNHIRFKFNALRIFRAHKFKNQRFLYGHVKAYELFFAD